MQFSLSITRVLGNAWGNSAYTALRWIKPCSYSLVTFLGHFRKYAREQNKLGRGAYYTLLNQELNSITAFADAVSNLDNAMFKISERSE